MAIATLAAAVPQMSAFHARLQGKPLPLHQYLGLDPAENPLASLRIDGLTVWEAAAQANHPALLTFLVAGFDTETIDNDGPGFTVLHHAANKGDALCLRLLLDCKANPNAVNRNGARTPLMVALDSGHLDAALTLIERGADPMAVDANGTPCLFYGVAHPCVLHAVVSRVGIDLSKITTPDRGQTILHHAAQQSRGARNTVLYLCEIVGIDAGVTDKKGNTPLHYACQSADADTVKALLMKGARSTIPNGDGVTVLAMRDNKHLDLINAFNKEPSQAGQLRITLPDVTNWPAVRDPKQMPANLAALFLPNFFMYAGSLLPTIIGFAGVGATAFGFTYVAKYCIGKKDRYLATAGWYAGALITGVLILMYRIFPIFIQHNSHATTLIGLWSVVTAVMFTAYLKAVVADPGAVMSTVDDRREIFDSVGKYGMAEVERKGFDLTTLVVKPLRAKHCTKTHYTVTRFDHFCVWTGNAIGGGNHRPFVIFCLLQLVAQSFVMYSTIKTVFYYKLEPIGPTPCPHGWCNWMDYLFNEENTLTTFFLLMYNSFVLLFCSAIVFSQLWYATRNVTSNEVWFADRYKWMFKLGSRAYSLYDRGLFNNLVDFFFTGNLTLVTHTVPPMNEHLTTLTRQFNARLKAKAAAGGCKDGCGHDHGGAAAGDNSHGHSHGPPEGGDAHGHSHGPSQPEFLQHIMQATSSAAAQAGGHFVGGQTPTQQFQNVAAMLPVDTQVEIQLVQEAVQAIGAGREPVFPATWSPEMRAEKTQVARKMHQQLLEVQNAMALFAQHQQQAPSPAASPVASSSASGAAASSGGASMNVAASSATSSSAVEMAPRGVKKD